VRRAAFPPVDDLVVLSQPVKLVGYPLHVATAGTPAELPQFPGGPLVAMEYFVNVVDVERAFPPAVHRRSHVRNEFIKAGLVVGGDRLTRGAAACPVTRLVGGLAAGGIGGLGCTIHALAGYRVRSAAPGWLGGQVMWRCAVEAVRR
jgi:hypothetical protein